MVEFIKPNGDLFSIARNSDDAFYMWEVSKDLGHTIRINDVDFGNDWEARYEIEKMFGVSYSLRLNF